MYRQFKMRRSTRRRGAVAVPVCISLIALVGFGSIVLDVGTMYNVRADLQRSADAAALAGASSYTTDDMMRVRMGTDTSTNMSVVLSQTTSRVTGYAQVNPSMGTTSTYVTSGDIVSGKLDLLSATAPIDTAAPLDTYNGVQVTVSRTGGTNPPVEYFFAKIFGLDSGTTGARAIAVFDDRFAGYTSGQPGAAGLPFTISENAYYSELASGGDNYAWNDAGGVLDGSSDGIREIRLYPYPLSGAGYSEGDGNFGVLNIGSGNQGLTELRYQIDNGVSDQDFIDEVGTSELVFSNPDGSPNTYQMTGSPGLDGGLASDIESIEGTVVAFFLHNNVILSGSNAQYTISDIRFGRVMDIKLTGPPHQRGLFIQPVSYSGSEIVIDPNAPSSGGMVGRLVLAR